MPICGGEKLAQKLWLWGGANPQIRWVGCHLEMWPDGTKKLSHNISLNLQEKILFDY